MSRSTWPEAVRVACLMVWVSWVQGSEKKKKQREEERLRSLWIGSRKWSSEKLSDDPVKEPAHPTTQRFSGGDGGRALPDPIPNSVVKLSSADGTAGATLWESRTPPELCPGLRKKDRGFFICWAVARCSPVVPSSKLDFPCCSGGVVTELALA